MVEYSEAFAGYVKSEGAPLQLGDFVELHTGEHMLERPPQEKMIEGNLVRVWVVEIAPYAFIPITEMFLGTEAPAIGVNTKH